MRVRLLVESHPLSVGDCVKNCQISDFLPRTPVILSVPQRHNDLLAATTDSFSGWKLLQNDQCFTANSGKKQLASTLRNTLALLNKRLQVIAVLHFGLALELSRLPRMSFYYVHN